MATVAHFQRFARYDRWANAKLYDAAAAMPDAEYRADRGAFFKSMHGTLNHVLAADRIWLARITGEGEAPRALNAILYENLPDLRAAREQEDARIQALCDGLTPARLAGTFTYRNMAGQLFENSLEPVLTHFFNHHTHHRGQAHAILTGLGRVAPELDLIYFLREEAGLR
jgi:uncharacterized damage-inducible protein DinB